LLPGLIPTAFTAFTIFLAATFHVRILSCPLQRVLTPDWLDSIHLCDSVLVLPEPADAKLEEDELSSICVCVRAWKRRFRGARY